MVKFLHLLGDNVIDIQFYRLCPNCKALRSATKRLSFARLPPVLLIHLKRFQAKGPFTDKIETFVDFPLKGLDLTNYMPPPLPPGVAKAQTNGRQPVSFDDPRLQLPPYRYDLYGVTNHYGSLSSGHCELNSNMAITVFSITCRHCIHCIQRWLAVL